MKIDKLLVNGRKTINYLKKNGLMPAYYAAKERIEQQKADTYQYVAPSESELEQQRNQAKKIYQEIQRVIPTESVCLPTFSALIPTYETKQEYLFALLDSLRTQSYPYWELVLVDASRSDIVKQSLEEYTKRHPDFQQKVCIVDLAENKGISENTNAGLPYCKGEYICLVDHDDLLTPDAFYCMAEMIMQHLTSVQVVSDHSSSDSLEKDLFTVGSLPIMIYSDEDKCNGDGTRFYDQNDKYKFNLDLILSNNYICHLTAIKREWFQKLQERAAYDGAQDYDLVLRVVSELIDTFGGVFAPGVSTYLQSQILHVPRVLYHWRCHNESTAQNTESKRYAYEAGLRAVEDFLKRHRLQATVEHSLHLGFYKVTYQPDILAARQDVAVVGGRLLDSRNKMLPCIKSDTGEYLYVGLHRRYSGRMHRFSLLQDVTEIDLRNAKIADGVKPLLFNILGKDCNQWICQNIFDASKYADDVKKRQKSGELNWKEINKAFCRSVQLAGYTIVYDPGMEVNGDPHTEDLGVYDA